MNNFKVREEWMDGNLFHNAHFRIKGSFHVIMTYNRIKHKSVSAPTSGDKGQLTNTL